MVLRRKTVDSSSQELIDYYANDESLSKEKGKVGYYKSEKSKVTGNSRWLGALKSELGLEDEIVQDDFKKIIYGQSPDNSFNLRQRQMKAGSQKERLFHDFCFSPNKSISIAALALGKTDLIEAHNEAIEEVSKYIEKRFAAYRQRNGKGFGQYQHGDRQIFETGKMLMAALNHFTARPVEKDGEICIDPQLHTHLLVMNTTMPEKGEWRSLFHELMSADNSLGFIYNQFLAEKVQALGYEIRQAEDGFELADISDEQIEIFSKRTQEAEQTLKDRGKELSPDLIHKQAHWLRKGKISGLTLEDLESTWTPQSEGMSVSRKEQAVPRIGHDGVEEELQYAIDHLSEGCVHFSAINLKHFVFEHPQKFGVEELESAIANHQDLINWDEAIRKYPGLASHRGNTVDRYTTPEQIDTSLKILRNWGRGLNSVDPLIESVNLEDLMKQKEGNHSHSGKPIKLNKSQAIAVKNVLESRHKYQAIHGLAGVGKTTAMAEIMFQLESNGINAELFGFAATHEAKGELEKSLGLKSRTVASLCASGSEGITWVVDESGMNSNAEWREVLEKAEQQGVRLIMIGDPGQNSSVNAGAPLFSVIEKYPESTQVMDEIIRQQNPKQLKAVELISAGRGIEAIQLLASEGKVTEISDRRTRARAIAKIFAELRQEDRDNCLIVSGTNMERRAITGQVRKALIKSEILGDSVEARNLVSRNLSETKAKLTRNYKTGDYVKFYKTPRSTHFKTGHLYKIERIEGDILHLRSTSGRAYILNPKKFGGKIEALTEGTMDVAVGDRVKFTATVLEKGWTNGMQLNVTAVNGEWIKAKDKDGIEHKIDMTEPVGIDYDWVGTSYSRQGKTAKIGIPSLTSDPTSAKESTTVSISRQTHEIMVFTESVEELHKWVQRSNRNPNVLDELGNDDRMIEALEKAIASHQQYGGKAQDHVERELQILDIQIRLEEIRTCAKTLKESTDVSRSTRKDSVVSRASNGRDSENISRDALSLHGVEGSNHRNSRRDYRKDASSERERESIDEGRDSGEGIDWHHSNGRTATRKGSGRDERSTNSIGDNCETEQFDNRITRLAEKIVEFATIQKLSNPIVELRSQLEELRQIKAEVEQERIAIASLMEQITPRESSKNKPVKLQAFWKPNYNGVERPENLEPKHWGEMQKSCIHPDLVKLNIESIYGDPVIQRLSEEDFKNKGSGQYAVGDMPRILASYDCLRDGGWWGSAGTDAESLLTDNPIPSLNGVFKGDRPRMFVDKPLLKFSEKIDTKNLEKEARLQGVDSRLFTEYGVKAALEGSAIAELINAGINPNNIIKYKINKYENPKGIDRPVFLANVPDDLAQKIYQKHRITPTEEELKKGFWHIIHKHNLPIILIEGLKKALASLSQGEIAIGTPGVALYRSNEKINGKKYKLNKRELLKDIAVFATPGRQITFAYDQDPAEKTKTIWNVRRDLVRSAELFHEAGCDVKVAKWSPEQGKGVDDLISISGATEYLKALNNAKSWEGEAWIWYKSRYTIFSNIAKTELGNIADQQKIDRLVYKLAVETGDRLDGVRVLKRSDGFKSEGMDYIQRIVQPKVNSNDSYKQAEYQI